MNLPLNVLVSVEGLQQRLPIHIYGAPLLAGNSINALDVSFVYENGCWYVGVLKELYSHHLCTCGCDVFL